MTYGGSAKGLDDRILGVLKLPELLLGFSVARPQLADPLCFGIAQRGS